MNTNTQKKRVQIPDLRPVTAVFTPVAEVVHFTPSLLHTSCPALPDCAPIQKSHLTSVPAIWPTRINMFIYILESVEQDYIFWSRKVGVAPYSAGNGG